MKPTEGDFIDGPRDTGLNEAKPPEALLSQIHAQRAKNPHDHNYNSQSQIQVSHAHLRTEKAAICNDKSSKFHSHCLTWRFHSRQKWHRHLELK